MPMFAGHNVRFQTCPQDREFALQSAAIDKLEQAQPGVIGNREHRAKRSLNSFRKQPALSFRRGRGFAKNFRKRVAKSALRFKAAAVADLLHPLALAHFAQG